LQDVFDEKGKKIKSAVADALIVESTYGDRIHTNRERELERLDSIILDAVARGEDIIIPTISLDRPVIVMYEIVTRLIKTGKLAAKDIDIYHFGKMLSGFVESAEEHEMMQEIERYYPNWERLLSTKEFSNSPGKSRLVIAGG
jgi:Cft2 family RNA processing exonuclease